jgi:hypothetical protein
MPQVSHFNKIKIITVQCVRNSVLATVHMNMNNHIDTNLAVSCKNSFEIAISFFSNSCISCLPEEHEVR